jgi:hypothetical protein
MVDVEPYPDTLVNFMIVVTRRKTQYFHAAIHAQKVKEIRTPKGFLDHNG